VHQLFTDFKEAYDSVSLRFMLMMRKYTYYKEKHRSFSSYL